MRKRGEHAFPHSLELGLHYRFSPSQWWFLEVSDVLPTAGTRLVGFAAAAILVGVRKTFNGGFADLMKSGGVAGGCLMLL
jgi:hypothetical protein